MQSENNSVGFVRKVTAETLIDCKIILVDGIKIALKVNGLSSHKKIN